ncbi:unnamed protein product [Brassicogethes aeneus]|uniref:Mab-21-like HhH/H2TH-like domain-containing protein n=1 Tax=Brassicogethes aeneus TaxID=1431903 RepID=A0A9P0BHS1_BRAAE|nr:unnamed protein product [Brassicogethes aeneus]
MFRKRSRAESFNKSAKLRKLEELGLPNAKLKFCPEQLLNINYIFNERLEENAAHSTDKSILLAKSVSERLVQRLLCGVGQLDQRFSSKFLICNHQHRNKSLPLNLKYLVRLDSLSTPVIYENDQTLKYSVIETDSDYPAGYARIRLHTSSFQTWGDYTSSNGYLRRDKVQAKFVELLAQSAARDLPNSPLQVDESTSCGIPGKILDPATLHFILNLDSKYQVYYGPGGNVPRFPDPRDIRLAIIDEPNGVKLKIEFLSPALSNISINVRLLVAIGIDAWPSTTNFPSRVSLGHCDCLLYHRASQTGMYLVGYGVQSSAWQIRTPAAEFIMLNHYGVNSTVRTVLDVLYYIMDEIDTSRKFKKQVCYKILNRYILLTLLLEELEENSVNHGSDVIYWSPLYLSTIVLQLMDRIIRRLYTEQQPNYFFKKSNLFINPGHLSDEDFIIEANNVKNYLGRLFDKSLMSTKDNEAFQRMSLSQQSEAMLLTRWRDIVQGLLPPSGTRGRRFCFAGSKNRQDVVHTQYTNRQLEYIGLLLKNMLLVHQKLLQADHTAVDSTINHMDFDKGDHMEDVIFILVTIMEQARDQYLANATNPNIVKNKSKIRSHYNTYTSKLVDIIRKDKEIKHQDYSDDTVLVKIILKWLYKAMDQNKRHLGPILRPYLNILFTTSHAVSWHLESIKQRQCDAEISSLNKFCELVYNGKITPAEGLIDAVNKNWDWAKNMLKMVEKSTLRIVFICDRGKVYRHILSLPSYDRKKENDGGSRTLESERKRRDIRRQKTLPNRSYFASIMKDKEIFNNEDLTPQHDLLKLSSPLTYVLTSKHRKGEHRGCGDVLKTLISMQKLNVFQEVTSCLPQEDRVELLEIIHELQILKSKQSGKKWSNTLPHSSSKANVEFFSKYTPKEESAGVKIVADGVADEKREELKLKNVNLNSLIGTCRASRIREDSNIFLLNDNFKIKSLLNSSDSFRF